MAATKPDPRDNAPRGAVPNKSPALYRDIPPDGDLAVWTDDCNFNHRLAAQIPMDGLDATVWQVCGQHGVRRT